jgi:protease I
VVGIETGETQAFNHLTPGDTFTVERAAADASSENYDGLIIPGGQAGPDNLRANADVVDFVRGFFQEAKPVAAICHGPWLLAEANVLQGRTVTSYPSIRTDLRNAGATVVDEEVVTDQGLVTSRNPDDIPAFNAKLVEEIGEGPHADQAESVGATPGAIAS